MKIIITHHRSITWTVLIAFFLLIQAGGHPSMLAKESNAKTEVSAAAGAEEEANPGAIEISGGSEPMAGKKHFPWLLVAGGVLVAGIVLYFTVIKKPKYDLTVTMGEGVDGSPAAGTYSYKKGTNISYNYTAKVGYLTPTVKQDGSEVASNGTITMNAAHTLEVNAVAGMHDDFSAAASSLWAPYLSNEWSVSGGLYSCSANRTIASSYNWNYNVCNYYISQTNYTVTVRQQRVTPGSNPFAILLATGNNMQGANGYLFDFSIDGDFYIDRFDNYNMVTRTGGIYTIQGWTINPAINSGLGAWNVVKVVRSGSTYTLIVNNTTVFTMNDSTYDPRYVALIHLVDSNILSQMNYDYVYIAVGSAAAAAPIPPRQALSTPSVGFDSTHRRTTGK